MDTRDFTHMRHKMAEALNLPLLESVNLENRAYTLGYMRGLGVGAEDEQLFNNRAYAAGRHDGKARREREL